MTDQSSLISPPRLRVFLCHSSGDKPVVRDLYRQLKNRNVDPWLDEIDLLPGQDWQQEIRKVVRVTDVVIVCLSQGSTGKVGFVQKEIKVALDVADEQPEGSIFLIPLKLEECELPERLGHLHAVDYFVEGSFDKLMRSLKYVSVLRKLAPVGYQADSDTIKYPPSNGTTRYFYHGHSASVDALAWSPDGSYIASGSADETVQVWDASSGRTIYIYRGHSNGVKAVAWSPDSKRIASGSWNDDGMVHVWDATTGDNYVPYQSDSDSVTAIAWSPTGKQVAWVNNGGSMQICDVKTGVISPYQSTYVFIAAMGWAPDGYHIATTQTGMVMRLWDTLTAHNSTTWSNHTEVHALAWSPNSKFIATAGGDGIVRVWDLWDISKVSIIFTYHLHSNLISDVAWSPDGQLIASGSWDKTVQIWNALTGKNPIAYREHFNTVNAVAWSPDGYYIASASSDGEVRVWQIPLISSF